VVEIERDLIDPMVGARNVESASDAIANIIHDSRWMNLTERLVRYALSHSAEMAPPAFRARRSDKVRLGDDVLKMVSEARRISIAVYEATLRISRQEVTIPGADRVLALKSVDEIANTASVAMPIRDVMMRSAQGGPAILALRFALQRSDRIRRPVARFLAHVSLDGQRAWYSLLSGVPALNLKPRHGITPLDLAEVAASETEYQTRLTAMREDARAHSYVTPWSASHR
jgi:hypothetical protein